MSLSLYQSLIPPAIRMLSSLGKILEKAEQYASDRHFNAKNLVGSRLFVDMHPLSKQIQIASDVVKGGAARLAGIESPRFEDNEETLEELRARIDKTIAFLQTLTESQFEGAEDRLIELKFPNGMELSFKGLDYLQHWILPNLYFHSTTAYNILRHNGVIIGKKDFLG